MKILPIGGYFPKDKNGFIINPASWELVSVRLQQLIHKLITNIPEIEKASINSIYLRGSLPRAIEEKHIGDIDLFILTKKKQMRWTEVEWMNHLIFEISKQATDVPEIECTLTTYDENLLDNYPQLAVIIKTQSICIYGPDFSKKLPSFKPGKMMFLNHRWLKSDLQKALSNDSVSYEKVALKTLIRTGFEIVMEREKEYTPDLYWCCHSFGKWYPKQANQMTKALQFYLNPTAYQSQLDSFLAEFGPWIVKESLKYTQ